MLRNRCLPAKANSSYTTSKNAFYPPRNSFHDRPEAYPYRCNAPAKHILYKSAFRSIICKIDEKRSVISPEIRHESAFVTAHSPGNCQRQILNTISGLVALLLPKFQIISFFIEFLTFTTTPVHFQKIVAPIVEKSLTILLNMSVNAYSKAIFIIVVNGPAGI